MEGLRKITQNLSQDSQYPSADSNQAPHEYENRPLRLHQPAQQSNSKMESKKCTEIY